MSGSAPRGGSVRPALALALTTVGFFALTIAALGVVSLLTATDVITVTGLGPIPGALGVAAAGAGFAGALAPLLRPPRPSYTAAVIAAAAAYLAYVLVTVVAAAVAAGDVAVALAVGEDLAAGWPGLVVAASAGAAGWAAVALTRTRAARPRWPWEHDEP